MSLILALLEEEVMEKYSSLGKIPQYFTKKVSVYAM